jgi:signal transduction histidine kinase
LAYKQKNQLDSAYKYLLITSQIKDSLYKVRIANLSAFQNVSFEETLRLESEQMQTDAKIRINSLLAGLMVVSVIGIILLRNNNQRKKSNLLLTSQKNEIEQQKKQVEESMERLQSTQSQLVQAEKMASLGELTAGIAHEIQNPLNFVNNFAEVNTELIDELKKEIEPAGIISANELIEDIKANSEKIAHHGNRADAIVKSMLQHSRKTSAQKELTDINALCDEYLRLAYHGLRAKEKSFNAQFETDFDLSLPKVNVVSQDIGRVILNLINNAFYAVNERYKKEGKEGYVPQVKVSTRQVGEQIEITVTDNGGGIPPNIREKIFQPFFTTKPTGEGTGLGLSMSYDIITKGHGGVLQVNVEKNERSIFFILIPI